MLRTLHLKNYRCFEDHTVTFAPSTVIVGRNNAGKSTIVEALHLIAAVVNRKSPNFTTPPSYSPLGAFQRVIIPKTAHLGINFQTAFHRYGEPPAILTATFSEGATVRAYVYREGIHATIQGPKGWISTDNAFRALHLAPLNILPQIAPLQPEEQRLTREDYITDHYYTRLSSRHFRNQLFLRPEHFDEFKTLAEQTWHGLRVEPVTPNGNTLSMLVTDTDFAAEVAWMGHGLQLWLQTMWFIAKTPRTATVVLDEPDVYMHPDLQRKLYRLIKKRFTQALVATHSVEIMAEADPSEILIVNNKKARSEYANSEPVLQHLIDQLGGIHNVHLARLWSTKKLILLEGKDMALLKIFHAKIVPNAETPIDAIPNLPVGGWGGWGQAVGSHATAKNTVGEQITTYCIFDSDYHAISELQQRYEDAKKRGFNLHIWERKEIENYLLEPKVIARHIKDRTKRTGPTPEEVDRFLHQACEAEKDFVFDAMATHLYEQDRASGHAQANKEARNVLNQRWPLGARHVVSGKTLLSRLSAWSQKRYGVAIATIALAKAFRESEIPNELRDVILSIEEGAAFRNRRAAATTPSR